MPALFVWFSVKKQRRRKGNLRYSENAACLCEKG